ncbi:hypothetical protein RIR_jg5510.t1 [Rhizophagus irregularis DAOM 181602=DAOM 197198]|uniref:Integrase catalytic domain-containing protein n=1 Tax=Rhizophagus irregularis (strain DAOM 197198w) TaxID=1432141 RepID=A0A015L877_RHIIW|nr:hypothetical protein RirG_102500 [Rhizophagus irregularis DAOM 197198w]GBC50854.1 hypothetical protein RIR_jg5510.t1 [Rhizophagus irregularis DAOM 181602=DAOM 197198]
MGERQAERPVIYIDLQKAQDLDRDLTLQKFYYRSEGYYRTAEKMLVVCKKAGYDFTLAVIKKWLNRQALYQIHKPRPKFIQYVSFIDIQDLNDVHQSDTTPFSHCKIGNRIYKHRHVIKDVATRFRRSFALTNKSSAQVAKAFQKIYDDPNCPLIWPNVLIIDRGTEFMGECKDLLFRHGVKIQYANSKRSVAIAERDHQEFEKYAYFRQDAVDFHLPLSDRSRAWVKGLRINDDIYNNTPTQLIGMSPHEAVKLALKGKKIIAKSSVKHRRLVGYNEPLLPSYTEVRHLLEPGELEGGRRRATDCNWSSEVFTINSYLIKENQPVLYKLYNGPRCSFVREELQIVPPDTVLPPKYILKH